jgi:hypothetical protein
MRIKNIIKENKMALSVTCPEGHQYVAFDNYIGWTEGAPHCPTCLEEWSKKREEYHILFGVDGKSIQFQGADGIVNPIDVLSNGRIVKKSTTVTRKNQNDPAFNYVYESVDCIFIPD